MQAPYGIGPGVRWIKLPLLSCRTPRKCSVETLQFAKKLKFGNKVQFGNNVTN